MLDRSKVEVTPEFLNKAGAGFLPEYLGIVMTSIGDGEVTCEVTIERRHMALLNDALHAGTSLTLADTACGVGCFACLPEGATGFATLEVKSNMLSSVRDGTLQCSARAIHRGRSTQVWEATVFHKESGRKVAFFWCTQFIMYPK